MCKARGRRTTVCSQTVGRRPRFAVGGNCRMKCSLLLLVTVAGVAVFGAGCSSSGGSDVKKVHVALTMDQKPLTDADVKLMPKDDPELGDGIEGRTASDGKVDLVSNPKRPIKAGRYVLLVRRLVREDGTPFK